MKLLNLFIIKIFTLKPTFLVFHFFHFLTPRNSEQNFLHYFYTVLFIIITYNRTYYRD